MFFHFTFPLLPAGELVPKTSPSDRESVRGLPASRSFRKKGTRSKLVIPLSAIVCVPLRDPLMLAKSPVGAPVKTGSTPTLELPWLSQSPSDGQVAWAQDARQVQQGIRAR